MALPAVDVFNGATSDPLSGNWSAAVSGAFLIGTGNRAQGQNLSGFSIRAWGADTFSANQWAEVSSLYGALTACGPAVRIQPAAASCYCISAYDTGTNTAQINKITAGANSGIGSSFAVASGDLLRLEISGSTLNAYRNGVLQASTTDTDFATGQPGLFAYLGAELDDFQADNVGTATPLPLPRRVTRRSRLSARAYRGR